MTLKDPFCSPDIHKALKSVYIMGGSMSLQNSKLTNNLLTMPEIKTGIFHALSNLSFIITEASKWNHPSIIVFYKLENGFREDK